MPKVGGTAAGIRSRGGAGGGGGGGVGEVSTKPLKAGGHTFVRSRRDINNRRVLVRVDMSKLDRGWRKDQGFYIPRGGGGAEIQGRRENFERFLNTGKNITAPTVTVDRNGTVSFIDGRHRTSVLRDRGQKNMIISVDRSQLRRVRRYLY